jgi:hypothetical protein
MKKYLGEYDLTSFNSMIVDSKYDNDKLKYSSYSMSNWFFPHCHTNQKFTNNID